MELIGTILQLQIQTSPLKVGEKPHRRYDPSPLRVVPALSLTREGIIGYLSDGETIIDVHHAHHPLTRNRGENGISFNFIEHYRQMQRHFGNHLVDGCAGENILIESNENLSSDIAGHRFAIRTQDDQIVYLNDVMVAAPCLEFSHFALNKTEVSLEAPEIKAALQFLDKGRRGFYTTPDRETIIIRASDPVYQVS